MQKMLRTNWKVADPLFRGDSNSGVSIPTVNASDNIVRHILYLEGLGRETPYLSTSEAWEAARHFAGSDGIVWATLSASARKKGVRHWTKKELLGLLKGKGKGKAAWRSAAEVAQACRYVEQWSEHLLDFSLLEQKSAENSVGAVFSKTKDRKRKS